MVDHLTPEQRFRAMSRVKLKDGPLEKIIRSELHRMGYRFKKHVKALPGSPDAVFTKEKVAIFIDGDFWHGYRFPAWEHKLKDFWKQKISENRRRDQKNFRKLRRMGWRVIRVWQHEIKANPELCIIRIVEAVEYARKLNKTIPQRKISRVD
jgi:DNA mismatch endonuclease (patch repair protein)